MYSHPEKPTTRNARPSRFSPKFSMIRAVCLLAGLSLLFLLPTCRGQVVTATLTGNVRDSSGASVPNAKVTATQVSTGVARSTTTTAEGLYNLPYLNPGVYKVDVEAPGFKKFSQPNVNLDVSTVARIDATLTPGNIQETVTVTGGAPVLQTENAEVAKNFGTQEIRELPIANRNFQALAGLTAGVSLPVQSFPTTEDPQGTTFFNANGQGNSANNTIVDGVDNTNPTLGLSIYLPNPEVVEEVHVTTSNYSAEFGRVAGAVVNVVTRGGTNEFHGSLYEFNRVAALAARDFFNTSDQPKPGLTRNEFGGVLGGPVIKDKTFFFFGYQGRYLRQSSTSINTVPLPQYLNGDFSGVPGLTLYDPTTGNHDGTGRQPFANNIIPHINPIAGRLNSYLPTPNLPGIQQNYVSNVPSPYDGNSYDARVDHNFSEQTKIFAKMATSHYSVSQGGVFGDTVSDAVGAKDYTVTAIVNLTHGFSPTLLTELRVGYNRYRTNVNGIDTTTITNQKLGIGNPNPDTISSTGFANVDVNGMPELGNTQVYYPLVNTDNLFDVVDSWSKSLLKHTLKWGVEIHRNRMDRFQPQGLNLGPRGLFTFNPGTTELNGGTAGLGPYGSYLNSLAAYLIGATDQTSRTYQTVTPTNRQTQLAGYLQDTYQVSSRLTLDLGLRYDFYSPITPRYKGGASNYDPATNTLLIAGYGDVDLATGVNSQSIVQPRVGFAYRIGQKSVVRGGYAISGWTGRFGFTGGTLSTQFPVINNVQLGNTGDYIVDGSFNSLPPVPAISLPSNGLINPAPNEAFFVIPSYNPLPYVENYNLTFQHEFNAGLVIDAGYVGNVGRQLPYNQELNAAYPGTGTAGLALNQAYGRTASTSERANGVNSNYNSLQVNLSKRFSQGLSFTIAYAYSKSLDLGSNQAGFTDNLNRQRQYGPADFDQTHMLTISHVYELPFGKGKPLLSNGGVLAAIASGWQLNGIFRFATGTPFTAGADATSCDCPGNGNFADAISPVHILGGIGPGQPWFTTSSFAAPAANQFGNAGRNTIRGPSLKNYDFSLFRTFAIGERYKLEFRGEFYNLTNTPHFSNPDGNVNDSTFGIVSGTLSGAPNRQVQGGFRFMF